MTLKNSFILFAVFMIAGISGYIAVHNGYYPVAIVNFDIITAREAEQNYIAAYKYFQKAILVYGSDPRTLENPNSQLEIKRGALEKLIYDSFVYSELKLRMRKSEFQEIADRKIDQFLKDNKNIEEAAKTLYGLSLAEFRERVLQPQAYKEVLEGRMFLNKENFDDWMKNKKLGATVIILSPKLEWKDGALKLRD